MTNNNILIIGRKGSGKSSLAKILIDPKNIASRSERVIIIDTLGEYEEENIIMDFEALFNFINENKKFRAVCRFTDQKDIDFLFALAFIEGNLTILCEEISRYISSMSRNNQNNFSKIINFGRHKKIDVIAIARRPSELSREFRSQIDEVYCFKQIDKKDLETCESMGLYEIDQLKDFNYTEYKGIPAENIHYKKIIY